MTKTYREISCERISDYMAAHGYESVADVLTDVLHIVGGYDNPELQEMLRIADSTYELETAEDKEELLYDE
jgi:hypothetical protein